MSRGRRVRIGVGLYQDRYGLSATVKVGNVQREKRYPLGTDLEDLRTWQKRTRGTLLIDQPERQPMTRRSSFARDVVRYLKQRKGLASYRSDRAHLAAWVERFKTKARSLITKADVELALAHWRTHGQRRLKQKIARPVAARTLRHRLRVLSALYAALDGAKAPTPLEEVSWPTVPRSVPQDVSLVTIRTVAKRLETKWPKDHARFLVLATTGRRPAEVMRTAPADLDFARRLWRVPPAKDGPPTLLHLNADMIAAWKRLIVLKATGAYDTTLYAQHLRKCGWPRGVRPYNVRHALAMAILRNGGDISDVQVHLGHASIQTTRRFYAGIIQARAKATSQRLVGRLPAGAASVAMARSGKLRRKSARRAALTITAIRRRKVAKSFGS